MGVDMPMVPTDTPEKRSVGRPTKLTPEKSAKFLEMVEHGTKLKNAAAIIGVNSDTIYHWVEEGVRAREKSYKDGTPVPANRTAWVEFSEAYACACAKYSNRLQMTATTCAEAGDSKLLQFLMRADDPERYGDRKHITADVSTNVVTLYPTSGNSTNTTLVLPEGDL